MDLPKHHKNLNVTVITQKLSRSSGVGDVSTSFKILDCGIFEITDKLTNINLINITDKPT